MLPFTTAYGSSDSINWDTIYYSIEHLLEQNSISLNQLTSAFPEN